MRQVLAPALRHARSALPGWRWPLALALFGVAALGTAFALFVALFDWNAARGALERTFAARTGRALVIAGDLHVQLGWPPRIVAHEISIANPAWAQRPHLLTARRITVALAPAALLRGAIGMREVELLQPRLALEQRNGLKTWALGPEGAGPPPRIGRLAIDDGQVEFLDAEAGTAITATVAARGGATADDVSVVARGTYRGEPIELRARGPSVLGLADRSAPYPVRAALRSGPTYARFEGEVTGLPAARALDGRLELAGEDLSHLRRLVGIAAPATPPYNLRARIRREDARWSLDDIAGTVGESDVAGALAYSAAPRRHLAVTLVSEQLDFDDLGPLIGAPPKTTRGESASREQREEAQRMKRRGQALPRKPFDFSVWQRLDLDLTLVGKRVVHPPALPVNALAADVRIRDGVLRFAPLRLSVAGGEIAGTIELDGRGPALRGTAEMDFRRLKLGALFPTVQAMRNARGIAHGRAWLTGTGSSVAELLGAAGGRISLAVERGTISQRALELVGLDIAETALLLASGDREVALHCAVADFDVRRGIATSNVLVLDTADTLVIGSGVVDLAREQLDLTVYPRPKDVSPFAARAPLHVRGSLREPQVLPDPKVLAARGLTAALLALVNPLLALAPFIETGPGTDSDCADLLARARDWSQAQGANASQKR